MFDEEMLEYAAENGEDFYNESTFEGKDDESIVD